MPKNKQQEAQEKRLQKNIRQAKKTRADAKHTGRITCINLCQRRRLQRLPKNKQQEAQEKRLQKNIRQAKKTRADAKQGKTKSARSKPSKKGGFFAGLKADAPQTVQQSIPYREMYRDGICRLTDTLYTKTVQFFDINYQLAQADDKAQIFEGYCDFLNYFDASIHVQLTFINQRANMQDFTRSIDIPPRGDEYDGIRKEYGDMLKNQLQKIHVQLTFINQRANMQDFTRSIDIPPRGDEYDGIRKEYGDMLKNQLQKGNNGLTKRKYITFGIEADDLRTAKMRLERIETDVLANFNMLKNQLQKGNNGLTKRKYITFGIEADDLRTAKMRLERIETDVLANFKTLGVQARSLNGLERLELLHSQLHPDGQEKFHFQWSDLPKTGLSTKDFISPSGLSFSKDGKTFRVGDYSGAVSFLQILAPELTDRLLADLLDLNDAVTVNLHIQSIDQAQAIRNIKRKMSDLQKMTIEEQKKAVRSGYDMDIIPTDLATYGEEAKNLLQDLQSRNERMFLVTVLVENIAAKRQKLFNDIFAASGVAQKYNCALKRLDYQQEQGLMSSLALGTNQIEIERGLTTSSTAIFVPFTTCELFQEGEALYYGLNALSNNLIMANRKTLKNPNGLFLGTPGSGKSFSAKREIVNVFLLTEDDIIIADPENEYGPLVQQFGSQGQVIDISPKSFSAKREIVNVFLLTEDDIIIADPENEYGPLVQQFGSQGQVIDISPTSTNYINPMDINLDYSDDENPITLKSDFILSLCDLIIGGKEGLSPIERTIIDRCTRLVYREYLQDPCPENMPILGDLYELLLKQSEPEAQNIATALEIYVNGSLNVFNHRSNIQMDQHRVLCFQLKSLGKALKEIGLLIMQDAVWNRVTANRSKHKTTWFYIDEFHLLLKGQTGSFSVEIWKRFRKWGGIPSGLTQNVKDLLASREIENIFENSDFIYMLNQAQGDRQILAKQLGISPHQLSYVTHSGPGEGLLFFGNVIIPFVDHFPKDTLLYSVLTTRPDEVAGTKA